MQTKSILATFQEVVKLNLIIGMFFGYIIHDAVKPTVVGEVLDKVSLPADLFVKQDQPVTEGS